MVLGLPEAVVGPVLTLKPPPGDDDDEVPPLVVLGGVNLTPPPGGKKTCPPPLCCGGVPTPMPATTLTVALSGATPVTGCPVVAFIRVAVTDAPPTATPVSVKP